MQNVTESWKTAQQGMVVPEQFIQIEYSVTDPDVQRDGTASSNGNAVYADTADITDTTIKSPPYYATLEHNIWGLDGEQLVLPDSAPYGDTGYIGTAMCDAAGVFATPPVVSVSFSKVHIPLVPGLTVTWSYEYDEYATSFRVKAYNGSTEVFNQLYEGNTETRTVIDADLQSYDEISIEILSWSRPYRRARMTYFVIGTDIIYTKDDLMSYTHTQSVDLLSGTLPKNAITFSLDNSNGQWNPDNEEGAEKYLLQRQPLKVRYGMKIDGITEWVDGGTFYMSEWSTPMNGLEATFTARDSIDFMNAVYTGPRSGTLYDIAIAALVQADLPLLETGEVRYFVDNSLKNYTTDFSADDDAYIISEILQMVANAGMCVMYQDRNGVLRIEPLDETLTDYEITQDVSYAHPEYDITKELKAVSVNDGLGYAENNTVGEVQTMKNPLITTEGNANAVASWAKGIIKDRKTISGSYRADIRLDALDKVTVESKYATKEVQITEINYSFTGGFKGTYKGRVRE